MSGKSKPVAGSRVGSPDGIKIFNEVGAHEFIAKPEIPVR